MFEKPSKALMIALRDFVFRHEIFVYESPLLMLTGAEYAAMPFQIVHDRLCSTLCGARPRLVLEVFGSDSTTALVFEDGSRAPGLPITR